VVVVLVVVLGSWLVRVLWWRRARCRSRLVVLAWLGPRIWLRQKQRSWDVWIASLGIGMLIIWRLVRMAAENVGVRRRIWRLHFRMRLSKISSCFGVDGKNWLV
jgi:hypothetical protein